MGKQGFSEQNNHCSAALRDLKRTIALLLVCVLLLSSGCCGSLKNRDSTPFSGARKSQETTEEETVYAMTELLLKVDDRVAQITLSPDSKRMIVETRLDLPSVSGTGGGSSSGDTEQGFAAEIWNVEFADARPETFSEETPYLIADSLDCAAFDKKGSRLFWTGREIPNADVFNSVAQTNSAIVRGAAPSDSSILEQTDPQSDEGFVLPDDPEDEDYAPVSGGYLAASNSPRISAGYLKKTSAKDEPSEGVSPLFDSKSNTERLLEETYNSPADRKIPVSSSIQSASSEVENAVLTKKLDSVGFMIDPASISGKSNPGELTARHVKINEETRSAISVRLSRNAEWLVCQGVPGGVVERRSAADKENQDRSSEDFSEEWALVPLRDRNRVVRFPQKIKMTFSSSTSDQEIEGSIIDVLDVSDSEDLAATLVEEIIPEGKSRALYGDFNLNPRYKIVVWDLHVAKTVDLEKALKPLSAIEVSQIAVPIPIQKDCCKFSPSGKMLAARVDPKVVAIWQSVSGREIAELEDRKNIVECFSFSPGETKMVTGTSGASGRLVLWDVRKGAVCRELDDYAGNSKSVDAAAFSNDERFVCFANRAGEIKKWNIQHKNKPE